MTTPDLAADLAADVARFVRHAHVVRRFVLSGPDPWPRFDPVAARAHPSTRPALAALAHRARDAGWANEPDGSDLFELLRGVPLPVDRLERALGPGADLRRHLQAAGLLLKDGYLDQWSLGFGVAAVGDRLVAVPCEPEHRDQVYLGAEALWLERWRAELDLAARRVVELGCGAGHLAVAMAAPGRLVVATDLVPRAVAMAGLAHDLNPGLPGASALVVDDLAAGLAPASADLVVCNPPWVPAPRTEVVYKHGGPTGTELPLRFLRAALDLVRPGGVVLMTTLDPRFGDGRHPLADALAALDPGAVASSVAVTPFVARHASGAERFRRSHPDLAGFDHVLVALRTRPPTPELDPAWATCWQEAVSAVVDRLRPEGWASRAA